MSGSDKSQYAKIAIMRGRSHDNNGVVLGADIHFSRFCLELKCRQESTHPEDEISECADKSPP